MFCKARKIPLPLQDRVKDKFETMVRQGILEPMQPSGVTNAFQYFALDNICFVQSNLVTQSDIVTELGSSRLSQDVIKRLKIGNCKQFSEAEKGFEQQKNTLTIHNGIIFRGVVPFILPKLRHLVMAKAHETHQGRNSTETTVRMVAWRLDNTQDVLR